MAKHYFCVSCNRQELSGKRSVNNIVNFFINKVSTTMGKTKFCGYADW